MKEWGNYSKPKTGAPISYLRTKYRDFGLSGHIVKCRGGNEPGRAGLCLNRLGLVEKTMA